MDAVDRAGGDDFKRRKAEMPGRQLVLGVRHCCFEEGQNRGLPPASPVAAMYLPPKNPSDSFKEKDQFSDDVLAGGKKLSNSTMETFTQVI
jgi:hypothetical protein